jgi:hypothetical protein
MDITVSTGQRFFTDDIAKVDFNPGGGAENADQGAAETSQHPGPSLHIRLNSGEEIHLFDEEAMIVLSLLPKRT